MNGKQAKLCRRTLNHEETLIHVGKMVEVKGTARVRTSDNGTKVKTVTMAHPRGSYRNLLKAMKGRNSWLFNPDENNHAAV